MGLTTPRAGVVPMQTFRRRTRIRAFGVVDSMVGILLLSLGCAILLFGFSQLLTLGQRQEAMVFSLLEESDANPYLRWF